MPDTRLQIHRRSSIDEKIAALIADMEAAGHPIVQVSGQRSAEEQAALYAKGRTKPGSIVTEKSGRPGDESRHQLNLARDFAFRGANGQPDWSEKNPWQLLGERAKGVGLEWGGDWTSLNDRPHVQQPRMSEFRKGSPAQAQTIPGSAKITDSALPPPPTRPARPLGRGTATAAPRYTARGRVPTADPVAAPSPEIDDVLDRSSLPGPSRTSDIALSPPAQAPPSAATKPTAGPTSLGLSPSQLGRAFRAAFPKYRSDIQTDEELYQHLLETQPDGIKKLTGLNPKAPAEGAHLPSPGEWSKAYGESKGRTATPLPTTRPTGNLLTSGATTAMRVVPPLAVAAGAALGALPTFGSSIPAGMVATGAATAAGESAAQETERFLGLRDEIEPKLIGTAGAFGMVPGLPIAKGIGTVGRVAIRGAEGAGLGLAQQETESRLMGSPPPSLRERATVGAFGAAFGGGFGALEGRQIAKTFEAAAEQVRQRTMTRDGLAQTIARMAEDAKAEGLNVIEARRYARDAAKALYAGRPLPEMPTPAPPRLDYPSPIGPALPAPPSIAEGPLPRPQGIAQDLEDAIDTSLQAPPRGGPRLTAPDAGTYTARPRRDYPEPIGPGLPTPPTLVEGPLPEPNPAITPAENRFAGAFDNAWARPDVAATPRLVNPDPGVTAREAVVPPDARARKQAQQLEAAGTRNALGGVHDFTALDAPAVPAPRSGDVPPTMGETTKFGKVASQAAKQQTKQLAPPMGSPLGKPSAATTSSFDKKGAQGVKKAVSAADNFAVALEPPPAPPKPQPDPHASAQGAAAVEAMAQTGSFQKAQRAAQSTLPPPPKTAFLMGPEGYAIGEVQVPSSYPHSSITEADYQALQPAASPTTKSIVLLGRDGTAIGMADVPESYPGRSISEAEYNSLRRSPMDPRGETGAVKLPQRPPLEFSVPPGDKPALIDWLNANRQHAGEGFYKRAAAALETNPARAWQIVQAETLRTGSPTARNKSLAFAGLRGEVGRVRQQEAGVRRTDAFPQPADVKPRQRGQLTLRISGLKDVGDMPPPTTLFHLPPTVQQRVLKAVKRAQLGRIKGNQDTDYRLFRQVAHQVLEGDPKMRSISRALGLTPEELASGWTSQVSEAARVLQRLSQLSKEIPNIVDEVAAKSGLAAPRGVKAAMTALADADDADEGLQQLYGGLFGLDPGAALQWARDSVQAMNEVHAAHLLEQQTGKGPLASFNDLRRAGLTGTIAAFWRNAAVGGLRWNAGIMSDAIGGILSVDPGTRRELIGRAKDRISAAPHLRNMLVKPWASSIFEMWPNLSKVALSGRDPRKTIKAISSFSDAEAHFLGLQQQDLPQSSGQKEYITLIQSANRAQEYPLRALAADLRLRQLIRRRGFDPNTVLNGEGQDLTKIFGTPEGAERAVQDAVGYGLDFTFASDTITGTINKAMIDTINAHPMLSAFQAFPRYAWSAAPRFVWDHSPGVLLDMATQIATRGKLRLGQRFMRGQQTALASDMLGRRETRLNEISLERGTALQERMALSKTRAILRRKIDTLERHEAKGTLTGEQRQSLGVLQREIAETNGALNGQLGYLGRLQREQQVIKAQNKKLAKGYEESAKAAAPESYGEAVGKATVGVALWSASHAIRSSEDQQDLPWYKIRTGKDTVVDARAFGPLTFFLFFGDLTASIGRDTDMAEFRKLQAEKIAAGEHKFVASAAALKASYHGKYAEGQALREGAQLVFGLSPAAGLTAAFYDMLAPEGLTVDNLGESLMSIAGEWLAGPLHPLSDVSNLLSPVFPEEGVIRDPGMLAPELPYHTAELTAPLTKIPGVKQMFPEQYSQTTGEVIRSQSPITRTLGGITLAKPPTPVESALQEAGVSGSKYYLPRLDDVGLTQQLSKVHAQSMQKMYDAFIKDKSSWLKLQSPEERRTYLELPGGPLAFARALTWAKMQGYGSRRIAELRESPAKAEATKRLMRVLERWSEGTQPDPASFEDQAPPPGLPPPPR